MSSEEPVWKLTYGSRSWYCGEGMTVEQAMLNLKIRSSCTASVMDGGEPAVFYKQCTPVAGMEVIIRDVHDSRISAHPQKTE